MKVKLGKNKKETILLTILVVTVIISVYFHLMLRPTIQKLGIILPKVSLLEEELENAEFLIAKKDLISKEQAKLQLAMDEYRKMFPSEQEVPKLLKSLSDMAGKSNMKIVSIKPFAKEDVQTEAKSNIYQEIPVEVMAESGYHQLGQFLNKLENGDRFIIVTNINITTNPDNTAIHDVELLLSTYVLLEK